MSELLGIYAGGLRALEPEGQATGMFKQPLERAEVTRLGIAGDQQADRRIHGGPDKALHHYPSEHHAHWRSVLEADAATPFRFEPGAVGENISSEGVLESDLCIGDVLRIGGALAQVSLGRQPCWKLDAHTGRSDMAYRFRKTGRTGWY